LNTEIRAFNHFWRFCLNRDIKRGVNPMGDRKAYAKPEKEKLYIESSRFSELLDVAETLGPRYRILAAWGIYMWSRQGEIGNIKIKDLTFDHEKKSGKVVVKIHKSKKIDTMPISLRLYEELNGWEDAKGVWHKGWLQYYREDMNVQELDPEWYLIPQQYRGHFYGRAADGTALKMPSPLNPTAPLSQTHMYFKKVAETLLGRKLKQEGGHTLRRSGARAYYYILLDQDKGHEGAIRIIMSMLHHKDMKTTEIYIGVDADKTRRDQKISGADMYGEKAAELAAMEQPLNVINMFDRRGRRS
jgi:integrase